LTAGSISLDVGRHGDVAGRPAAAGPVGDSVAVGGVPVGVGVALAARLDDEAAGPDEDVHAASVPTDKPASPPRNARRSIDPPLTRRFV
jgi:hypothetical protein